MFMLKIKDPEASNPNFAQNLKFSQATAKIIQTRRVARPTGTMPLRKSS
jgi:hypothetical protein